MPTLGWVRGRGTAALPGDKFRNPGWVPLLFVVIRLQQQCRIHWHREDPEGIRGTDLISGNGSGTIGGRYSHRLEYLLAGVEVAFAFVQSKVAAAEIFQQIQD